MTASPAPGAGPTIAPTTEGDLSALGQFLTLGFHAAADAPFAAADVLRWKALDPAARDGVPRSFVARDAQGAIVGHVGLTLTAWRVGGAATEVPTLHLIDWLGSPAHLGLGTRLMRRAHALAPTQYVLGASGDARRVIARAGYATMPPVPVYRRVLRPRWRGPGPGGRALARAGRDLLRLALARPARPAQALTLQPVTRFGVEVEAITAGAPADLLFTGRHAGTLNWLLDYPRGGPLGYLVRQGDTAIGFAVVNLLPAPDGGRVGKVADLFLASAEPTLWHAGFDALATELRQRGADTVVACGSTPWAQAGLSRAGFRPAYALDLFVRDRDGRLPCAPGTVWHLGFLEADYAVLP